MLGERNSMAPWTGRQERRAVVLVALTVAAAEAITPLTASSAAGNLLKCPSFEQVAEATGYPVHWLPVWGKPTSCAYTLASAKHGVASALITDDRDDVSHGLRSVHTKVMPGRWYEATVSVRIAECKQGGFALYLEFWNQAKVRGLHKAVSTDRKGEWQQLKVRLKAPADAAYATVLIYGGSVTVGRAYFDCASLTAEGNSPQRTVP